MDGGAWWAAVHGVAKESDTTQWLHFHFSLSCIGEGNGNPLQCSCLENLSDGGAWWAAVYGVTQSWTRLKQLSISKQSWTIKKAERWRIDVFELWCQRRLLRVPWVARRFNKSFLKISSEYSLKGLMLKRKLQYFAHLMGRTDSLDKPWCWERLKVREEGDNRGWDSWMASLTQWTCVWASSGS